MRTKKYDTFLASHGMLKDETKMTLEEWRSTHTEGAVQYDKSISWFKDHVKCCYNCSNWYRDHMLMGDYAYNSCLAHKDHMTVWDAFCDDWCGFAEGKEENLLAFVKMKWEE